MTGVAGILAAAAFLAAVPGGRPFLPDPTVLAPPGAPGGGTGPWVAAAARTWEAVPGELESSLALGFEPASGAGFHAGWLRLWGPDLPRAERWSAGPVAAGRRWRVAGAWTRWRWARRGEDAVAVTAHLFTSSAWGGVRAELDPRGGGQGAEVTLEGSVVQAPWAGLLRLGPGGRRWSTVVSVAVGSGMVCSLAYRHPQGEAAVGMRWLLGSRLVLDGARGWHPFLGRLDRVGLAWGRAAP